MFVDSYNSFYSNLDLLTNNDSFIDKRKTYYETTIKKKKGNKFSYINETNSLIIALRNFSVKYGLDDKKILNDYKFVISFDELISLIRFSLESQIKLNNFLQDDSEKIKSFIHNFINNISNYIFSYEKVEKINPISKFGNKIKFSTNKENININTNKAIKTSRTNYKKPNCIIKSSSCVVDKGKSKIKQPKNKVILNRNYQTNLKSNKSTVNSNKINNNSNTNFTSNTNRNQEETNNYTKSYFRRKNYKNLTNIFSPIKKSQNKENNKIKVTKTLLNKSAERRHNPNDYFKNDKQNYKKIKLNKSMEKRKTNKSEHKIESKPISIFSACEYLKSSSFILKTKNNKENKIEKKEEFNTNNSMNDIKKEDKKIVYYDQNMNLGIRKKIIKANVPRPSNYANKLLEKGIKFITDFNGLKEEELKKKFH